MKSEAADVADLLLPYVRSFVGSSGGGQYSFQLLCSVRKCYRQDSVSASRHTVRSETHRKQACKKFAAQGWVIKNGPVCPDCLKAENA
jgi:hypothetical protein